jgi:hypothetical protein
LKAGENEIQLTVPAGDLTTGVVYDYLRLELDEAAAPGGARAGGFPNLPAEPSPPTPG